MPARSIKEVTRALQIQFTAAKTPLALPPETRRLLQQFVNDHEDDTGNQDSTRADLELKLFWEKYVEGSTQKLGAFASVLRELRPVIREADLPDWWQKVIRPVLNGTVYNKVALEDAREFIIGVMVREHGEEDAVDQATTTNTLCSDLMGSYIARTRPMKEEDNNASAAADAQITQQIEEVLVAFGRKRPKDLLHHIDDLVRPAATRLQALTLLSSFLRYETPHLYLVVNTPLVEDLLKCLMNDTSTTVLSVALTSLIMLLPHIPGSLGPYLPRLFLVYSRLLCWEKFSPLSTQAQRNLVTDDRIPNADISDDGEHSVVGIDTNWEIARPEEGIIEAGTPELMTYFTYLYGLYPLNLMSYIRKPRRYLKNIDFPGADDFDLDQAVIRSRTEQFQRMHVLHPNFYRMTVEEELVDPKWPKMDPADVVGECHGLALNSKSTLVSPGPPPTTKLPDIPPIPALSIAHVGTISPVASHVSMRSGVSWRDTHSTAVSTVATEADSPVLKPQVPSVDGTAPTQEKAAELPQDNVTYLQREITLLRNDLNFERWHKAQYSQHIGQIMRRNVKEATVEAETLNLIHANRALRKQLDQMRKTREATMKDSALTRKQANSLEANLTDRFNKFKSEQEAWQADADELQRLRSEMHQYRELLVASEARELKKSHELQLARQDVEQLEKLQAQVKTAQKRIHEYEYRDYELDEEKRVNELLQSENKDLQIRAQRLEEQHAHLRQAYATKVVELEAQISMPDSPSRYSGSQSGPDVQAIVQHAIHESQGKLAQLKKAYSKLVERHTDLELEYQSVKTRLDALQQGSSGGRSFYAGDRDSFGYDIINDYTPSEAEYMSVSTSDPTSRRFQPPLKAASVMLGVGQVAMNQHAGLVFEHEPNRRNSIASKTSSQPAAFNQSAPLRQDEDMSAFSDYSGSGSQSKKEKIKADSQVRVYGRGGAQNIKLKTKDSSKSDSSSGKKSSGLKGLRSLV